MTNILLLHYNNYFNRIVKKESSVANYRLADTVSSVARYKDLSNMNFVPGDGITTKFIIGKGDMSDLELSSYDYVVVYNKDANNNETIMHRWFILEYNRTRGGQYEVSVRRDVIVDYNDKIANAPIFVDKAIIQDIQSPFLYNNENVNVNQIKTQEILLRDGSFCPWLVMYLKKNCLGSSDVGTSGKITINTANPVVANIELNTPITDWVYYPLTQTAHKQVSLITYQILYRVLMSRSKYYYRYSQQRGGEQVSAAWNVSLSGLETQREMVSTSTFNAEMTGARLTALETAVMGLDSTYISFEDYVALPRDGAIIKDSLGKYYRFNKGTLKPGNVTHNVTSTGDTTTIYSTLNTVWQEASGVTTQTPNNNAFKVMVEYNTFQCTLTPQEQYQETIDFVPPTQLTQDSPLFDAICLPYGDFLIKVGSTNIYTSAERSLVIMNDIARQLSSSYVLDLQLLPYCPIQDRLVTLSYIDIPDTIKDSIGLKGIFDNNLVDYIPIVPRATFTFDIYAGVGLSDFSDVPDTYKVKYFNDCTMVRLCSPNYNGVFEFNLAKNSYGDSPGLTDWNVDMTLRPYNPYIHVNPKFDHLYGRDFNDARGLICGGDFSLGIIDDAWVQYEIQNKNYQAIFDRQIQNLDVNNKINKEEAGISAILGGFQGAMRGGITGGIATGSPWGAAAGAVIGGAASAVGGALDMYNLERRQKEQRDYAIDNYNLQLGNVKALPNSITKTSALTANNKLFPFVEVYECTEQERDAYFNKIKYDGVTVGIVDELQNYVVEGEKNFFKGQLIRCEEIQEDNHMLQEINNELAKGVYI